MKPEDTLPCSQDHATGQYPEPYEFSSKFLTPFLVRSILILSFHIRLGLPSGLFHSGFLTHFVFLFYSRHILRPSYPPWFDHLNDIWWSVQVMKFLRRKDCAVLYLKETSLEHVKWIKLVCGIFRLQVLVIAITV